MITTTPFHYSAVNLYSFLIKVECSHTCHLLHHGRSVLWWRQILLLKDPVSPTHTSLNEETVTVTVLIQIDISEAIDTD
jgi:hypothetical protein